MPNFNIAIPHQLGQQEAAGKLKGFLEQVRSRYQSQVSDLEENWNGNTLSFGFKTYGFNIKGSVIVEEQQVELDGNLPFAAVAFKGKIEQSIRDELEKVLV